MDVESSDIIVIHDRIAPEIIPESIIGIVILIKVLILELPKLSAASSILGSICNKLATEDLIVYGNLRIDKDITIIKAVPVIVNSPVPAIPVLKDDKKAIPSTVPGTMYGIMLKVSIIDVIVFFFLTAK